MKQYVVRVVNEVLVELDETKFTPEFMEEFSRVIYKFDTVKEHAEHLGWLIATGRADVFDTVIEGYGDVDQFGLSFQEIESWVSDISEVENG